MTKRCRTKLTVILVIMIFSLVLSGCRQTVYTETKLTNGEKCFYFIDDSGEFFVKGVDILKVSKDEIISLKSDDVQIPEATGKIENSEQAAIRGSEVLNEVYDNWTYQANTVVVMYNRDANLWGVFGQVKDRNSVQDIGKVIFDAQTGEILFISLSHPEN